jgi:hypothetical protein
MAESVASEWKMQERINEEIIMSIFSILVVILALGVAGWSLFSGGLEKEGIEALFIVVVCLATAAIFAVIPVQAIRKGVFPGALFGRKTIASGEGGAAGKKGTREES